MEIPINPSDSKEEMKKMQEHFVEIGKHLVRLGESLKEGVDVNASEYLAERKEAMSKKMAALKEKVEDKSEMTEKYVRENPWQAVGIVALAGMILGIMMRPPGHK